LDKLLQVFDLTAKSRGDEHTVFTITRRVNCEKLRAGRKRERLLLNCCLSICLQAQSFKGRGDMSYQI